MFNGIDLLGEIYNTQSFLQDLQGLWLPFKTWLFGNARVMMRCLFWGGASFLLYLLVFVFLVKFVVPRLRRKFHTMARELLKVASRISLLVLWLGLFITTKTAHFQGVLAFIQGKLFAALFLITFSSIALHTIRCFVEVFLEKLRQKDKSTYGRSKLLLELSYSVIQLLVWCLVIVLILQKAFDFDVGDLLVSAGVMGMGVAFAAQNTIANVFGAFSILGGNLFKVGDWIKTGNYEGIVEKIGFRSVRIRNFTGHSIDVPNRVIADSPLENYSNRHFWREHFTFGLVYQTTPEQINKALQIIDEIGVELADLMVSGKKPLFYFLKCNDFSLDLEGFVWFKGVEASTMREGKSKFNNAVLKRFNEAGLSFAYPTSTVFLEGDGADEQPPCVPPPAQE